VPWLERTGQGWIVRWRVAGRGSETGQSRPLKNRPAAESAARPAKGGTLPWAELVERWQAHHGQHESPRRYVAQGALLLRRLAAEHRWSATHDVRADAVSRVHAGGRRVLFAFLRWAELHQGQTIDRRALIPAKPPARKPERPLLTDAQVAAIQAKAEAVAAGNGALVHLIATYGHRAENLVRATVDAFDPAGWLTLTVKGGDRIRHPLLPEAVDLLRALAVGRAQSDPLFPSHLGRPFDSGSAFSSWFTHSLAGHGYYDLKRYAISRMLAGGVDAKTVASITGHRTVSLLLNTYARTNEDRQKAALLAIRGNGAQRRTAEKT
jgi:integrase